MEIQPSNKNGTLGAKIAGVLSRATERLREDPLFADTQGYSSIDEVINLALTHWDYKLFAGEGGYHPETSEVQDTQEILSLPDEELQRFGAKIDLLRGYQAMHDGGKIESLWYFDLAQSGFLKEGDLSSFALASAKFARVARDSGMIDASEEAHRNAIQGYQEARDLTNDELISEDKLDPSLASIHDVDSFYEYRRLARTLGTPTAIAKYGAAKLKELRKEIDELYPVNRHSAVYGVLALMQTEYELSKTSRLGELHYKRAKRYGFISDAAEMGMGLGIRMMLRDRNKKAPATNSVKGWAEVFSKGAPDMMAGGANNFGNVNSNYW